MYKKLQCFPKYQEKIIYYIYLSLLLFITCITIYIYIVNAICYPKIFWLIVIHVFTILDTFWLRFPCASFMNSKRQVKSLYYLLLFSLHFCNVNLWLMQCFTFTSNTYCSNFLDIICSYSVCVVHYRTFQRHLYPLPNHLYVGYYKRVDHLTNRNSPINSPIHKIYRQFIWITLATFGGAIHVHDLTTATI